MEYFIAIGLTFIIFLAIIILSKRKKIKSLGRIVYSQSSIHERIKYFIPKDFNKKPDVMSQSKKHVAQHMVKIIVIDGKAYWVKDNIFYMAETLYGNILPETAKPVDIDSMPKQELDKMLFILDNLSREKKNERGSAGNE